MRCLGLSVCRVRELCRTEYISQKKFSPSGCHTILVFPYQRSWKYSDGNPPNGASNAAGVGRNSDSEPAPGSIACYCYERQVQVLRSTERSELMTLVAGKRRSLLMVGDDDEVYDKNPQRYAEQHLIVRSGKS